jgi:hypothetical protein
MNWRRGLSEFASITRGYELVQERYLVRIQAGVFV